MKQTLSIPSRGARPVAVALYLLAGSLWIGAPARADWLVTRDGGKVETRGPWKLETKRVVFTLADGTLSSLRLSEVDLDASRQATAAVAQARAAEAVKSPAPPKKAVRVLTDKDFARPEPEAPAPGSEGEGEAAAAGGAATPAGAAQPSSSVVQVTDWTQNRNQELKQIEITGSVRNTGKDLATAVSLTVRLYDVRDEIVAAEQASLDTRALRAGQNTAFRVAFPNVIDFAVAKFEVNSIPLMTREPAPEDESAEDAPPGR
ncbi:MAG TPA: FxLYD domain-containing protein [Thermoanaerobaculia bacterium]|nr:FxLYD domain-containing protein [Thermoanaerobaculia bacterium]